MAQPSVQAPSHWMLGVGSGYDHASDLLRAILGHQDDDNDDVPRATSTNNNKTLTEVEVRLRNEILRTQPDIIALQECPARDWSARVICAPTTNNNNDQRRYVSVGTAPSHCGYVDLLVRRDWNWERIDLQRQQQQQEGGLGMTLPSVAAVVNIPLDKDSSSSSPSTIARLAVSSSHLAPHRENAYIRFHQLQQLVSQMQQKDEAIPGATDLILLGDMNMRKDEDGRVERIGWVPPSASNNTSSGGLLDAWKEAGSDPATRDTWNSYVNRYHGADAFEFRCRFDRTYYRPAAALAEAREGGTSSLRVVDFGLVGNRPILRDQGGGGPGHFLSDHFGMSVAFDVARLESDGHGDGERTASHDETQPSRKKTKLTNA